jgi:hypothetical protein
MCENKGDEGRTNGDCVGTMYKGESGGDVGYIRKTSEPRRTKGYRGFPSKYQS